MSEPITVSSDDSDCEYVELAGRLLLKSHNSQDLPSPRTEAAALTTCLPPVIDSGTHTLNQPPTKAPTIESALPSAQLSGDPDNIAPSKVRCLNNGASPVHCANDRGVRAAKKRRTRATTRLTAANCHQFVEVLLDDEIGALVDGAAFLERVRSDCLSPVVLLRQTQRHLAGTVMWRRSRPPDDDVRQLTDGETKRPCEPHAVLILSADRYTTLGGQPDELSQLLTRCRCALQQLTAGDDVTTTVRLGLLVWAVPAISRTGNKAAKAAAATVVDTWRRVLVTHQCCVHVAESCDDAAQHVCRLTKALALRPIRLGKKALCPFEWFSGAAPAGRSVKLTPTADNSGRLLGLRQLWLQQLQLLPGSCLAAAHAIAAVYPSLPALRQAYVACKCEADRVSLLANLSVQRSSGPVVTATHKLGAELSRKLYLFICSTDGSAIV